MKQAIAIRTDLKMGKGKIASQAAHASIASFLKASKDQQAEWLASGMKKIVVKVPNLESLEETFARAKRAKLPCEIITDAGLTQLEQPEKTAVGIGPAAGDKIDMITGKMKLL